MGFDAIGYKLNSIQNWDSVAHDYHFSWAFPGKGPFKSTLKLVDAGDIRKGDKVLDLACGTGAVSAAVAPLLDSSGLLVGVDFSMGPLLIAKTSVPRAHFVRMDAENVGFKLRFDKVLCQYGLMFFPDATRTLTSIRSNMEPGGTIAVCVHGTSEGVPYFSTIMDPVLRYFPTIRPAGTPTVHRYGLPGDLESELLKAGFRDVNIEKFTFDYQAGSFENYWNNYLATTANSIRKVLETKQVLLAAVKDEAKQKSEEFEETSVITFPWDVLIATASV